VQVITKEFKEQFYQTVKHPVWWVRGAGLPEERVAPWEMLIHIVDKTFSGLVNGYTDQVKMLYTSSFGVSLTQYAVADIISGVWDAINDPLIGSYMDRRPLSSDVLKWVMRTCVFVWPTNAIRYG
jgi:hypothetical protein